MTMAVILVVEDNPADPRPMRAAAMPAAKDGRTRPARFAPQVRSACQAEAGPTQGSAA